MTDIPKESFNENYMDETTQATGNSRTIAQSMFKTGSLTKLPGIRQPLNITNTNSVLKASPNNRYGNKVVPNIVIQPKEEDNVLQFRKKQVNKMLDHYFK